MLENGFETQIVFHLSYKNICAGEGHAPMRLAVRSRLGEKLSGSEMVVRSLEAEGVEFIFGYPGGAVLHIYDAL